MERMQIRKKIAKGVSALLAAVVLCANLPVSVKAAEQPRVVRLPYGFNDFLKVDQDGSASGYYAEYFEALAQVNNWEYEYVETTWPEAMNMIEKGEIDLLYPVNYSEERDEFMDYCDAPIGYISSGIYALKDSHYAYMDFDALDGTKIACARNTSNEKELEHLSQEFDFTYEIVYKETNYELTDALVNGEADFAIFNSAAFFPEGKLVAVLDPNPVYLTVTEGNTELLKYVNSGMNTLMLTNSNLAAETWERTIAGENDSVEAYTKEELEYLGTGKEIVVGFYTDTEPLAYIDEEGKYSGVYIEYVEMLNNETDLNFTLVPLDRSQNYKEELRQGRIDYYIGASDVIVSTDSDIYTTNSFMEYSNCLVTRTDYPFDDKGTPTIALTYGRKNWVTYVEEKLNKDINVLYYETAKECMLAVMEKKADAAVINNLEFNYQSKNERLSSLIRVSTFVFPTDICFATTVETNKLEVSVLNKAMHAVSEQELDELIDKYMLIPYHSYSFEDYIYNSRYLLMVVTLVLVMLIAILAINRQFKKKKYNVEKEAYYAKMEMMNIFTTISREFECIYFVDIKKNEYREIYSKDNCIFTKIEGDSFYEKIRNYARQKVVLEDQDKILSVFEQCDGEWRLKDTSNIVIRYQIYTDKDQISTGEVNLLYMDEEGLNGFVFEIRRIDELIKKEMEYQTVLADALASANKANQAKSDFLSRMSHDIRTPMNAIVGLTTLTQAHADDPVKIKENMDKISHASRYLLSLINEVLDMNKIEAGKLTLSEENIGLSEFTENFLEIMKPKIAEHSHELNVQVYNVQHENVVADSTRLEQLFMNIMGNAIKYTPDGGKICLSISELPCGDKNMSNYVFCFSDNGMGMSEEFQKHMFEPFQREEDVRISKIQGTGLGLSIVRNIVQLMNGEIDVKSKTGKGTIVTITLPFAWQLEPNEEMKFEDMCVLVADDDRDACESLTAMLGELGIKSMGVTSGEEAVEAVRKSMNETNPFNAVILDWKMPGMDGIEAAKKIRKFVDNGIPIIILSAYDWSDVEVEARTSGVDLFLNKPVFKSQLIRLFQDMTCADSGEMDVAISSNDGKLKYDGIKILLVEDTLLNREIAKELLEMEGMVVEEAENGKEAVERFAASTDGYYDMILMDIRMPIMNGYDAARAIRGLERTDAHEIPIVAMTADAFPEDVMKAKLAGMDEHISKPIEVDKLKIVFKKYFHAGNTRVKEHQFGGGADDTTLP